VCVCLYVYECMRMEVRKKVMWFICGSCGLNNGFEHCTMAQYYDSVL
jgi:hypothetical protein